MLGAIGYGGMAAAWQQWQHISNMARPAAQGVSATSAVAPEKNGVSPVGAAAAAGAAASPAVFGPSEMPYIPEGYGPEELATRTKAMFPETGTPLSNAMEGKLAGLENELEQKDLPGLPGEDEEDEDAPGTKVDDAESPADVMNEEKCETCAKRKYKDGSDDPGVSFKFATRVDPKAAQAAVRGHEMEHVVRERAKAKMEGRKVVSQSVTYHTGICPECGKFYIAGGTTRTVTAADNTKDYLEDLFNDDDGFDISA